MDVDRYNADYRNGVFKTGLFVVWSQLVYRRKDKTLKRDASARLCDFPLSDWCRRYYGIDEPTFDNVMRHPRRDDPFWTTTTRRTRTSTTWRCASCARTST